MKTLLYSTFITLLLLTSCQGNSQTQDQEKATLQNQNITPVQTKPINASNTGRTGHAEAVEVLYDPKIVSFSSLVDVYFGSQNPTQINGQGPDRGSQYRSIIFYQNENQKKIIQKKKDLLGKTLNRKIAAEVTPFQKFWKAEGYHQDYEKRNPYNRYIQNVSIPRLKRFHKKFPELIKEIH